MPNLLPLTAAAAALILASCTPPPPVPPPRFKPNPPYPPVPVDPYSQPADPYGQNIDVSPPPAPTPPAPETPTRPGEYPLARKTANPDQVTSPYEPYNVIDIAGFKTGQLARDPSNKKIFRVP